MVELRRHRFVLLGPLLSWNREKIRIWCERRWQLLECFSETHSSNWRKSLRYCARKNLGKNSMTCYETGAQFWILSLRREMHFFVSKQILSEFALSSKVSRQSWECQNCQLVFWCWIYILLPWLCALFCKLFIFEAVFLADASVCQNHVCFVFPSATPVSQPPATSSVFIARTVWRNLPKWPMRKSRKGGNFEIRG